MAQNLFSSYQGSGYFAPMFCFLIQKKTTNKNCKGIPNKTMDQLLNRSEEYLVMFFFTELMERSLETALNECYSGLNMVLVLLRVREELLRELENTRVPTK